MDSDEAAEWSKLYELFSQPARGLPGAEYRRDLLLHNRERIELAYETATTVGLDDPVVLVLDLRDVRAARLARATGWSWQKINDWRRECRKDDYVPTLVTFAQRWAVMLSVGPTSPHSPRGIAKLSPPGTFRVVAMAAGGNSFADFPLPPVANLEEE